MSRAAFMAGVQHAAAMLREAETIRAESAKCPAAIEVEFLEGQPQRNFATAYLSRILLQPETLEGFAAVLSDFLGMDTLTTAEYYAELTESQIFDAGA